MIDIACAANSISIMGTLCTIPADKNKGCETRDFTEKEFNHFVFMEGPRLAEMRVSVERQRIMRNEIDDRQLMTHKYQLRKIEQRRGP